MAEGLVIETANLRKSSGDIEALRGLDLAVPAGSIFGFLGRNGPGKTTTLKALLGMTRPSSCRRRGRQTIEPIHALYREATIDVAGYSGTIKAWHTADGHYRKEERVPDYATIETFDGTTGVARQEGAPARTFTGEDLARARSTAFANWAAVFFAFFPERVAGTRTVGADGTIVLHPEGGIPWRVGLDPATCLPKVMTHKEGPRTVTVTFNKYETIDGLTFEQEIHRSNGIPMYDAVIRFTKTIINPGIDPALFRDAR